MKKIVLSIMALVVMASSTFGWATIGAELFGRTEMTFTSNTNGVKVSVDGIPLGVVNGGYLKVRIKRDGKDQKVLTFEKRGYKTQTFVLSKQLDVFFLINVACLDSIGSSIDSLTTKNIYGYSPTEYYIDMQKI